MLRFTGEPKAEKLDFTLSHPTRYLDDEIAETLSDALKAGQLGALLGLRYCLTRLFSKSLTHLLPRTAGPYFID
jgi:hypothetical protein